MNKWLDYCVRKARERKTRQQYRLHAVLVRGGSVQAEGTNQDANNSDIRIVHPDAPSWMGIHAEIDCVRRAMPAHIEGSTMFVGGVNKTGELIKTKPCRFCARTIRDTKIYQVYFHTRRGKTLRGF